MTSQFFYGTLRDPELLAVVLGHSNAHLTPATLPNYAVFHAGAEPFPQILPKLGAEAKGLLARNLSKTDIERLAFYEEGYDYLLRSIDVVCDGKNQTTKVWFPPSDGYPEGQEWSLLRWQESYGRVAREAASEAMTYLGLRTPQDVANGWRMIDSRAQARLIAAAAPDFGASGQSRADDIEPLSFRRPYARFFALEEHSLRFRNFDGRWSEPIERAVFIGADAALVLPYDPKRDVVLLVEQFRSGPFARGDRFPWCLEPIAGMVDGGEAPEDTARREALEEANLTVHALLSIGSGYASPGDATGFYHMFCALTDLPETLAGVSGVESESENIKSHILSADHFFEKLDAGAFNVIPLQLMGHWLARHRETLRARA